LKALIVIRRYRRRINNYRNRYSKWWKAKNLWSSSWRKQTSALEKSKSTINY